jgi:hypothetical protein
MIDQPSLAILIDCWDSPNNRLPQNIISFLDDNKSIHTVVLASYNCKQHKNNHWFHKYVEIFVTNQVSRKIRDLSHVHRVFNQSDNKYPEENTHPLILNYISKSAVQLTMTWLWELEYYLSIHPEIQNIYVLGQAWEMCVRIRPLGYEYLPEIFGINILTNSKCVLTMDAKFPELTYNNKWKHVTGTIWEYKHEYR